MLFTAIAARYASHVAATPDATSNNMPAERTAQSFDRLERIIRCGRNPRMRSDAE
jgi:hypothetical protein